MNDEIKKFFGKARNICQEYVGKCRSCHLNDWCVYGIFGANAQEIEDLINVVEEKKQ